MVRIRWNAGQRPGDPDPSPFPGVEVKRPFIAGVLVALSASVCLPATAAAEDTTPPDTKIFMSWGSDVNRTLVFFADEPISEIECRVDQQPWMSCKGGGPPHQWTTPKVGSGPHLVQIRATDLAGNVELEPAYDLYYVKPDPPRFTFEEGVFPNYSAWTTDTTPTVRLETDDPGIASFKCGVDWDDLFDHVPTAEPEVCGTQWTPNQPLSDGKHRFAVASVDRQGTTSYARFFNFEIDSRPPVATLIAPGRVLKKTPVKVRLDAYDENPIAVKSCLLDGRRINCEPQVFRRLKVGRHRFSVYVRDMAGNEASAKSKLRVARR